MAQRIELRFAGTMAGFGSAFDELRGRLDGDPLPARARYGVELVFEEIVANIVRHGRDGGGVPSVAVALEVGADAVTMTIDDDGPPFDPSGLEDPALPGSLEDAEIGGLGLMLVRRAVSGMEYGRTADRKNRLVVTIPARARA